MYKLLKSEDYIIRFIILFLFLPHDHIIFITPFREYVIKYEILHILFLYLNYIQV